ncbi:MAG: Fur family transcriptional regulator [Acidobacteriota bacterium]
MRDGLDQLLRKNGLQVTAQRLAILRAVAAHPHGTADELIEEVREVIGSISRQAVYDSLGVMVEKSIIRRIQPAGSPARYEDRVGDNHHHLICRGCAIMFDIDCAVGETPCLIADDDHGFEIDEAEVIYWGYCPECQQAAKNGTSRPGSPKRSKKAGKSGRNMKERANRPPS